jgi:hypothetical protein
MIFSFFNVIVAMFMFGGWRGEGEGFYISLVMKIWGFFFPEGLDKYLVKRT